MVRSPWTSVGYILRAETGYGAVVAEHPGGEVVAPLREALKRVAVLLKQAGIPFALAGGYALYARGGPEPEHDVDFAVPGEAVEQVVAALEHGGLRVEQPPEDWLFKAWVGDGGTRSMVDLVHRSAGGVAVDDDLLSRAEEMEVFSVRMPVLPVTDVLCAKLRALSEHFCDFSRLLPAARSVREQVDWRRLHGETADNDFAAAFLFLAARLGIAPQGQVWTTRR